MKKHNIEAFEERAAEKLFNFSYDLKSCALSLVCYLDFKSIDECMVKSAKMTADQNIGRCKRELEELLSDLNEVQKKLNADWEEYKE